MDKYQVLLILIVWYIVAVCTTAVFQPGNYELMQGRGEPMNFWDAGGTFIKLLFEGLFFGLFIPGCPLMLTAILTLPFWCLLIYFIYLNVPSLPTIQKPQP